MFHKHALLNEIQEESINILFLAKKPLNVYIIKE